MQREMMIYDVEHLERLGWLERIRFTLPHSKRRAFKENGPMDRAAIHRIIRETDFGLSLKTGNGLIVADKDGEKLGPYADLTSPMSSTTSRGDGHDFFRTNLTNLSNKLKPNGLEVDVICNDNSIICIPPSELATGQVRRWKRGILPLADLPLFPPDLLRAESVPPPPPVMPRLELPDDKKLESLRRSIGSRFAESGNGGDAVTYKVALRIVSVVRDFDKAMAEILAWDRTNAIPPWSDTPQGVKALEHKVRCAMKYLLK